MKGGANSTLLLSLFLFLTFIGYIHAQTPHVISYQGQIQGGAQNGEYQMQVTLYADPQGNDAIWTDTYSTEVLDGIFNIQLGSGKSLPDSKALDRQLWLGVAVNGSAELRPLTKLSAVPLALNVVDEAVTLKKLAPEVIEMLTTQDPQTANAGASWSETGNYSLTPGTHFLGTTDASPLQMRVNNLQVMKYSDNSTSTYEANNILGGWNGNTLGSGTGNVLAGGGYREYTTQWYSHPNRIGNAATTSYGFLGGGFDNDLDGNVSVLGGGEDNNLLGQRSFLGGGYHNAVGTTTGADYAALVGGSGNTAGSEYSFVGGGSSNTTSATRASVVGGSSNTASGQYSSVLGGHNNTVNGTRSSILGGGYLTLSGNNSLGFHAYNGTNAPPAVTSPNTMYLGNTDLWLYNYWDDDASELRFYEPDNQGVSGSHYTSFKATDQTATINYVLPSIQGAANTVLTNNGSGTLSWGDADAGAWKITGNSNIIDGTNYIGTTIDAPFEVRVYNGWGTTNQGTKRAFRIEPVTGTNSSPNIIGGYQGNSRTTGVTGIVISGGGHDAKENRVTDNFGFIGGGVLNLAGDDDATLTDQPYAAVAGGEENKAQASHSFIGGGYKNTATNNTQAVIGGGDQNTIESPTGTTSSSGILSGKKNKVTTANHSIVAGGEENWVKSKSWSFIGSGFKNEIDGGGAGYMVIGGGLNNYAAGTASFIGGGGSLSTDAAQSGNNLTGDYGVIVGGFKNKIIGSYSSLGGGKNNEVNSTQCVIAGGELNVIQTSSPYSTIAGGMSNKINSSTSNTATFCAIPGGDYLTASSYAQAVIGAFNKLQGDSRRTSFRGQDPNDRPQDAPEDRIFIVGNGYIPLGQTEANAVRHNAFEVSNNGHSIVYDNLGVGGTLAVPTVAAVSTRPAVKGARYVDNTPIAWGRVHVVPGVGGLPPTCSLLSGSGVKQATGIVMGHYRIELDYIDPYNPTPTQVRADRGSAVVATIDLEELGYACFFINTSKISWTTVNTFDVKICQQTLIADALNCTATDHDFSFIVFGRPDPQ